MKNKMYYRQRNKDHTIYLIYANLNKIKKMRIHNIEKYKIKREIGEYDKFLTKKTRK